MTNHLHLEIRFSPSTTALIHQVQGDHETKAKTDCYQIDFDPTRHGKIFLTYFRKADTSKLIKILGHNTVQSLLDNRLHSSSDIQGQNLKRVFQAIDTDISGRKHFTSVLKSRIQCIIEDKSHTAFLVSYYMMKITEILIFLADIDFVKQYILAFKGYLQLEDYRIGCRFVKFVAFA